MHVTPETPILERFAEYGKRAAENGISRRSALRIAADLQEHVGIDVSIAWEDAYDEAKREE